MEIASSTKLSWSRNALVAAHWRWNKEGIWKEGGKIDGQREETKKE
jgi:hypothetical protein